MEDIFCGVRIRIEKQGRRYFESAKHLSRNLAAIPIYGKCQEYSTSRQCFKVPWFVANVELYEIHLEYSAIKRKSMNYLSYKRRIVLI